jgi:DNA polymerase-3 subunit gamma/tau
VHRPEEPQTAAGRTTVAVAAAAVPPPGTGADPEAAAGGDGAPVADAEAAAEEPAAVAAVAVVAPGELTLEGFAELWPAVLEALRADAPLVAGLLEGARPVALAEEGLTLAWPQTAAFSKRKAEDPANRDLIARAIRGVTGASVRLAYELSAEAEAAANPTLSEEELLERFVQEFDAELLPEEDQ